MGRGSYTAGDWAKLKNSRGLVKNTPVENLFTGKRANPAYDSRLAGVREARDSVDSPRSTPVILGFDVTASMGYLAKELAVNSLHQTITTLLARKPISNPQILCAAIGDVRSDQSPLQVTQFESDIRMVSQLTDLWLEGGGGGNGGESYNLLWYFAARHTQTDCYEKRRAKGYLFTIGDDACHEGLRPAEIRRAFGDTVEYPLSNAELLRMAAEKYEVFHIHIETGGSRSDQVFADWQRLLPGHCTRITRSKIGSLAELIPAAIAVAAGFAPNEVLKEMDQRDAEAIAESLALIEARTTRTDEISF